MGILIPQSTQILILKEREKMLNNVVNLIGRLSEELIADMNGSAEKVASAVSVSAGPPAVLESDVEEVVERVIEKRFTSLLHDIDYRIKVLYDAADKLSGAGGKVGSRDLNLAHHLLDGYTFTSNSPVAGSIAWAGCHIVYKGTDYTITDGSTADKYVYWLIATPTVFTTSATKPILGADDVLVAINDGGIARVMLAPGKMIHGGAMVDGTVGSSELGNGAVTSNKIAALAVLEDKLADGAVTSAKLGVGAVTTDKIGDAQVTGPKIGAGAIAEQKLNLATHLMY